MDSVSARKNYKCNEIVITFDNQEKGHLRYPIWWEETTKTYLDYMAVRPANIINTNCTTHN